MNDLNEEVLMELAKCAEQSGCFNELADAMKTLINNGRVNLNLEERALLADGFKNKIGTKRSSWRVLIELENIATAERNSLKQTALKNLRDKCEQEINSICFDLLVLIEKCLNEKSDSDSIMFYLKLKGDFLRYKIQVTYDPEEKKKMIKECELTYKNGLDLMEANMSPINSSYLGHVLNYAVFNFEILSNNKTAIEIAQNAFDRAIVLIEEINSTESGNESILLLQLIKDNIEIWTMHENQSN